MKVATLEQVFVSSGLRNSLSQSGVNMVPISELVGRKAYNAITGHQIDIAGIWLCSQLSTCHHETPCSLLLTYRLRNLRRIPGQTANLSYHLTPACCHVCQGMPGSLLILQLQRVQWLKKRPLIQRFSPGSAICVPKSRCKSPFTLLLLVRAEAQMSLGLDRAEMDARSRSDHWLR